MYEQWIIALLVAPLVIAFESFALRGTKNRTVCTAFHITGLILMLFFSVQVISGVLEKAVSVHLTTGCMLIVFLPFS